MTEKEQSLIRHMRGEKYRDQHGHCGNCGKEVNLYDGQLAHRIPQRKWCIKRYGAKVIHHSMNLVLVCGLDCNAKVQLNPDSLEAERLAARIGKSIKEDR